MASVVKELRKLKKIEQDGILNYLRSAFIGYPSRRRNFYYSTDNKTGFVPPSCMYCFQDHRSITKQILREKINVHVERKQR